MSVQIIIGDALNVLRGLPDESADCCVTSPPYWGLRDYGVAGQLGLEPTLGEHIAALVELFEEVRRILKPHGTFWLNYGDCYATTPNGRSAADTKAAGADDRTFRDKPFSTVQGTLKPKDLCMIPNRLAIALQDAGWWVRSEIVWRKTNPMPDSSGAYRPSSAHEKIFMLTKSGDAPVFRARDTGEIRFDPDLSETCALITDATRTGPRWIKLGAYWDAEAVRVRRNDVEQSAGYRGSDGDGARKRSTTGNVRIDKQRGHSRRHQGFNDRWDGMDRADQMANGRLLRNAEGDQTGFVEHLGPDVWDIATAAYHDAHFATFPPDLVVPCILGGCPRGGTVLDPFGGSGTTGLVAQALGRDAILIELNPEYAAMAERRLKIGALRPAGRRSTPLPGQIGLFDEVAA